MQLLAQPFLFQDEGSGVPQWLPNEAEKNDDTVEKIVKIIIQNEANVEALKEMLGESEEMQVPVPSSSQDGGPPHHHTVHLGSTQAPCIHCSRRKRHPLQRQGRSKEGKSRMHPGETTVFSVGRYPNELCQTFPCWNEHHRLSSVLLFLPPSPVPQVPLLSCMEMPQEQLELLSTQALPAPGNACGMWQAVMHGGFPPSPGR
ncbi:hypothetical protein DV515_00015114 [Chloebia gouldiae]|uniref:Uncharacterized protein n=1 Tax=Chloebia gouldiae TaxID=44316 RepID=A0A3L8RXM6_CHLGU|nr:hypothetical protein DV515_00015114 [Chloebia gouldiae]